MNRSQSLFKLGQSIWFDNVNRRQLRNGWFAKQISERKFVGVTSNPSIFKKAISEGSDYALDIQTLSWSGFDKEAIYEELVIADIQTVASLLHPVYEATSKKDGYVSLEVNPLFANDTDKTIQEAQRLWKKVNRENLMIKIPGTEAGIPAIREVTAAGINVNVTLIFSTERYLKVIDAYYSGLEDRIQEDFPISAIHSVASFFISRMDVMVEDLVANLEESGEKVSDDAKATLGRIGIQNGLIAYAAFEESIASDRFKEIKEIGGNKQRPLWASTGTKNPVYSDVLYVDHLVLPDTVNTVPPKTLDALLDHAKTQVIDHRNFKKVFQQSKEILQQAGIDFKQIFKNLELEGVEKFAASQTSLLHTIEKARERQQEMVSIKDSPIQNKMDQLGKEDFPKRFYLPDPSVFTENPDEREEVLRRMGWVDAPEKSVSLIPDAQALLRDLLKSGYSHAVVLGMGGSSLAPEVFSKVFVQKEGSQTGLTLSILDSTDPDQITRKLASIPLTNTLFIASSKSGTTAEMKSLVAFFTEELGKAGVKDIGSHFMCITDPGTALESYANQNNFRAVINADAKVGGRYSALTAFGIVPAVLAGIDAYKLLDRAELMRTKCGPDVDVEKNPAFVLAVILSISYNDGNDKLTILADLPFQSFGSWLEQLVAESSGKYGKGLIPIDREPTTGAENYSKDRIFYYLRADGKYDDLVEDLKKTGFSVIVSNLPDTYDIGGEIYKWEVTIAAFCSMIGVNPFNQPNVQASKSMALKMIEKFKSSDGINSEEPSIENQRFLVFGNLAEGIMELDGKKLIPAAIHPEIGDFISINAFVPRIEENQKLLDRLRKKIKDQYAVPVTLGFGPRFLHSTGQLHKGGKNNGIFIVLTQEPTADFPIPGEGIDFSTLEKAQALGETQALEEHDRRVLRVHYTSPITQQDLDLLI